MMKYTIKRKRLPKARRDQVYTLTIYMGYLGKEGVNTREAKVQYPVISHREGLCKYRELRRLQRLLDEAQSAISVQAPARVVQSTASPKPVHANSRHTAASKQRLPNSSEHVPIAV